jgi:hypothetical protein
MGKKGNSYLNAFFTISFAHTSISPSTHCNTITQALIDDPTPKLSPMILNHLHYPHNPQKRKTQPHPQQTQTGFPFPPISSAFIFPCPTTPSTNWSHTPTEKCPHLFLAILLQKCDRGFGAGFFFKTSSFLLQDVDTPCTSSSSTNILAAYLPSPSTRYTRAQTTRSMNLYYYYYYYSSLLVWIRSIHDARAHVGAERKTGEINRRRCERKQTDDEEERTSAKSHRNFVT